MFYYVTPILYMFQHKSLNNKYVSQEYMNLKYVFTLSTVYSVFLGVPIYHYPSCFE